MLLTPLQLEAISLFSGIDGLYEGFREVFQSESKLIALCEKDEQAYKVLKANYRGVPIFREVVQFSNKSLPKTNWNYATGIIFGGSPCQGISSANPFGGGLADKRSGLWSEQLRIINEFKPLFAVWENVEASLRPKRDTDELSPLGTVIWGLAQSGYDCQWQVIPLSALGSPHIRKRVFVVAHPAGFLSATGAESWSRRIATDRLNLLDKYTAGNRSPKSRQTTGQNEPFQAQSQTIWTSSGGLSVANGVSSTGVESTVQSGLSSLDDGIQKGYAINRGGWWTANSAPTCEIPPRTSDNGRIGDIARAMLGIKRELTDNQKLKQCGNAVSPIHAELVFMYIKYLWDTYRTNAQKQT